MTVLIENKLNMTNKQLDKHLKRFIGKSNTREFLQKGYTNGNTIYATDGHKLLKIVEPKELIQSELVMIDDKHFNKFKNMNKTTIDSIANGSYHKIRLTRESIKKLIEIIKLISKLTMLVELEYDKEINQYILRAKHYRYQFNMETPIKLEYTLTSFVFCSDDNKIQSTDNKILLNAQYIQYMLEFAYDNKDEYIEMYVPNDSKLKPIAIFGIDHTFSIILLPVRPN